MSAKQTAKYKLFVKVFSKESTEVLLENVKHFSHQIDFKGNKSVEINLQACLEVLSQRYTSETMPEAA